MIMNLFTGLLDFDFTRPFFMTQTPVGGVLSGIASGIMKGFGFNNF